MREKRAILQLALMVRFDDIEPSFGMKSVWSRASSALADVTVSNEINHRKRLKSQAGDGGIYYSGEKSQVDPTSIKWWLSSVECGQEPPQSPVLRVPRGKRKRKLYLPSVLGWKFHLVSIIVSGHPSDGHAALPSWIDRFAWRKPFIEMPWNNSFSFYCRSLSLEVDHPILTGVIHIVCILLPQ